ncbi:longevity assurance proteins LAG1/LAC1 [Aspergillus heterothallicus]
MSKSESNHQVAPGAHRVLTHTKPTTNKARGKKQKSYSAFEKSAHWLRENQLGFSFNIITLLCLTHLCMPEARAYTTRFFWVSHYNPRTGEYAIGGNDLYFLVFWIVLFTGIRASVMEYLLAPLAKHWGVTKVKDITRFTEQAWLLCYYSVFWTLGLYIYCTSKYFLNLREMFTDWPTRELSEVTKAYILCQWAFWLQQLVVINIEERRKDHWQMLAHHIITIVLMSTSYALHLTRVANLVLVLMDVVDIVFPLAKCLKYLGFTILRDVVFGIFMLSWFIARHVFYLVTMWSIWTHMAEIIPIGCYHGSQDSLAGPTPLPDRGWSHLLDPFLNPSGTICYSDNVRWGFLGALGFLQVITLFWFVLIVKVAIRVVQGMGADDIRSDDELQSEDYSCGGGDENNGRDRYKTPECRKATTRVGAETVALENPTCTAGGNRITGSSGIHLSGHYSRKEILGRIGCEKQSS